MIRSEELIDKLVATLHFHGYIHLMSSDIFGNGPLNLVANESQIKHIQNYIDDIFIDYFFRTHQFKPIIIPKDCAAKQYTKNGIKDIVDELELNLNNPFDRYTFVNCISDFLCNGYLTKIFHTNSFINDIWFRPRKYGPIWEANALFFKPPYGYELEQYLNYLYDFKHSKYNPQYRANDIIRFSKLYQQELYRYCNEELTGYGQQIICDRQKDYKRIKDLNLFGEYTFEDILFIYCLLVDKFKIEEENVLKNIALFANDLEYKKSFLNEFQKFEFENNNKECIEPFIRDRDLFLRFTSTTKSKAVKFNFLNSTIAEFQFFNEKPIQTTTMGNTLPLPFLYQDMY